MTTQQMHVDAYYIAQGDMMSPDVLPGDLVLIQHISPKSGQMACVELYGEVTLLNVKHIPGGVQLYSNNTQYAPMTFTGASLANVRFIGVMIGSVRLIGEKMSGNVLQSSGYANA